MFTITCYLNWREYGAGAHFQNWTTDVVSLKDDMIEYHTSHGRVVHVLNHSTDKETIYDANVKGD